MKRSRICRSLSLFLCLALWFVFLCPALPAKAAEASALTGVAVSLGQSQLTATVGTPLTLSAHLTLTPADAGYDPASVIWEWVSQDPDVAVVTPDPSNQAQATVTPVSGSAGKTTVVSVKVSGFTDSVGNPLSASDQCTVVVQFDAATELILNTTTMYLDPGKSQDLRATVQPDTADPTNITWESSSAGVARVSPTTGSATTIVAVAPGNAVISATSGGKAASCRLVVPGIVLSTGSLSLVAGGSEAIGFTTYGEIGTAVEWSSSRTEVAEISGGRVIAHGPGTTTITAIVSGTSYSASCTVSVRENTAGLITATASAGQPLFFSSLGSDLNSQCNSVLGWQLSYLTNLSVNPSYGVLYYGYASSDDTGAGVGSSERYYYYDVGYGDRALDNVAFVPNLDFTGSSVDITYTGYAANGRSFQGTIRVTVEKASAVTYSTASHTSARFQASDFNAICRSRNGRDLDYVTFSLPTSNKGTLYYNYSGSSLDTKVSDNTRYYRSGSPSISDVSFVPAEGFTGSISIQYSARDSMGYSYLGRIVVNVSGGNGGNGEISYQVQKGKTVTFNVNDFSTACRDATGGTLNYVRFDLPSYTQGTLYYNYYSSNSYDSKVTDSRSYYRSQSPYLSRVSFVPNSNFAGTVNIDFTGWSNDSDRFVGTISIVVGSSSSVSINYSAAKGKAVDFRSDDFDSLCRSETGYALDYVRFDLPSSSQGTLYYQYTSANNYGSKVSSSRSYYANSSSYLSQVSFVPNSSYSGTASIDFTGWDKRGTRFTGTVYVKVGTLDGVVSYSTPRNKYIALTPSDFNTLCQQQTGSSMKYVRFDLPSSSQGRLYYRYTTSGNYDSTVSSSVSYYRSATPYLSDVSFVPASGYSGTSQFNFTGYSDNGASFSGTVEITVGSGVDSKISYSVTSGKTVTFDDSDFNSLCRSENGVNLSYVRFDLPSSSQGILYYNYTNADKYDSKVSDSRSYYRSSSPYLSSVTFVPAAGYTGTVALDFSGWDTSGSKFTGTVEITVKPSAPASAIVYTTGTSPVTFLASDFQTACNARDGGSFVSASFTLPADSVGRLFSDYRGPNNRGTAVSPLLTYTPSGNLLLSKVSFVPKAGFSGTVTLSYTGVDSNQASYTGTIQIVVSPPAYSTHFSDMSNFGWAIPAVEYLYDNGITTGVADARYRPDVNITRGDFMLMLCRALSLSATGGGGFRDVSANSYYADAVNTAQALGIAQGDGAYFYPESPLTRQDAAVFLYRAMRSAGWSIPDGDTSYLNTFPDRDNIYNYSKTAVSSMVELGILQGNEAGKLMPGSSLSRAEMAVILHRAMTL